VSCGTNSPRTYAVLLDALNHHRGKGQQKVTVEHVHVHSGRQAVVGMVETPGGGSRPKSEEQPRAIAFASGVEMPSPNPVQSTVPRASYAERPLPPGAPKGNKNAFKHGRYTAEAVADRREIATLLRAMNVPQIARRLVRP